MVGVQIIADVAGFTGIGLPITIAQAGINASLTAYTATLNAENLIKTERSAAVAQNVILTAQNTISQLISEMVADGCGQ